MVDDAEVRTLAEGERLLVHYCRHSAKYWPERAQRQSRKLEQRVRTVAKTAGATRGQVLAMLAGAAIARQGHRRRTVHLANIGSSGSHWLEHMLVEGAGMLGAGEVYLPSTIKRKVSDLPAAEAGVFTDALLLLHAGGLGGDEVASVIHSQHSARPEPFLTADPKTLRVLLIRDPVDICLSRVYRKDEYRRDVAPDAGDMAYLDQNIAKIAEFLRSAKRQVFDLVLRYEDLVTDPVPGLEAICALTGSPTNRARLEQVSAEQAAERISGKDAARATNLYVGSAPEVPSTARQRAVEGLGDLGAYFGYPDTDG